MGPARQRGRPRLRFPRDVGGPGPTGATAAGGAGGVEPGARPTAGAALLGSGAVFPAESSVCVRESARRHSVPQFPRPEGAADPPSEHQASACLRCPPPPSGSSKNCSPRPCPPSLKSLADPSGHSSGSEPSWPVPASPQPLVFDRPLSHSPLSLIVTIFAQPGLLLQHWAKLGGGAKSRSFPTPGRRARLSGLCRSSRSSSGPGRGSRGV